MMDTTWHDLNRVPLRPSRLLTAWRAQHAPSAQRENAERVRRLQLQSRSYEGAAVNRLTADWMAPNTSADSELMTSLRMLRARSRELVRDNPHAKHLVRTLRNNVIGQGIGMQAQVKSNGGKLQKGVNDNIEDVWAEWSDRRYCHTAGLLGFADIEQLCVEQLVTAGEVLLRKHRMPFGGGRIPLALEVIEADLLLDNWQAARAPNGNMIRMGVEIDVWHRPVAYWFSPRHPGDYQFTTFEPSRFVRVPAEDVIHLYVIDRWPQTRGEPWMHATLRSLRDEGGLSDAEIQKARASANLVGFIRTPESLTPDTVQLGRQLIDTEPGTWQRLLPGEDVAGMTAYGPNPTLDPFLRYMVRKMGIGVGLSYETVSGDRSNTNYSSIRMGALDDRSLYRILQGFFIRNVRVDIHRELMDASALVSAVKVGADYWTNSRKWQAARFRPRGWSWIDPTKEVLAYKAAVRNGFMTLGDVIDQTSPDSDLEETLDRREQELEMCDDRELVFDSDPRQVNDKGGVQAPASTGGEGETPASGESGEGSEPKEPGEDEASAEGADS